MEKGIFNRQISKNGLQRENIYRKILRLYISLCKSNIIHELSQFDNRIYNFRELRKLVKTSFMKTGDSDL